MYIHSDVTCLRRASKKALIGTCIFHSDVTCLRRASKKALGTCIFHSDVTCLRVPLDSLVRIGYTFEL